jgi:hypothetical protein
MVAKGAVDFDTRVSFVSLKNFQASMGNTSMSYLIIHDIERWILQPAEGQQAPAEARRVQTAALRAGVKRLFELNFGRRGQIIHQQRSHHAQNRRRVINVYQRTIHLENDPKHDEKVNIAL